MTRYYVDVEYDDQSVSGRFGPISSREKAEDLVVVLASRTDVKNVTLTAEA